MAWYAHQLPKWYLRLTSVATNIFEIVIPLLFFFPNRKVRIVAFYLQVYNLYQFVKKNRAILITDICYIIHFFLILFQVYLQICIIATGNYNFFNFLTICLCISLLDDQFFYKRKSKNDTYRTINYLSTILTILIYGGVVYGTYSYFNLKITDKWTIQSDIGIYSYLINLDFINLIILTIQSNIYKNHNSFFCSIYTRTI